MPGNCIVSYWNNNKLRSVFCFGLSYILFMSLNIFSFIYFLQNNTYLIGTKFKQSNITVNLKQLLIIVKNVVKILKVLLNNKF